MFRKTTRPPTNDILVNRIKAIGDAPTREIDLDIPRPKTRGAPRTIYRPGLLTLEHGERLEVVIRDISESGIRVEFFRQTPLSHLVLIDEASLPLRRWGRVIWQREGASGLYFLRR